MLCTLNNAVCLASLPPCLLGVCFGFVCLLVFVLSPPLLLGFVLVSLFCVGFLAQTRCARLWDLRVTPSKALAMFPINPLNESRAILRQSIPLRPGEQSGVHILSFVNLQSNAIAVNGTMPAGVPWLILESSSMNLVVEPSRIPSLQFTFVHKQVRGGARGWIASVGASHVCGGSEPCVSHVGATPV